MGHNVESLFREVADLGPAERADYYDKQNVSADLRSEVESLLEFDGTLSIPLVNSVASIAERALNPEPRPAEGGRCGPYQLDRLLGQGGMGMVFLAHRADGEVEQRVAIKLVRNAAEEPSFRDRFLKERQILASLSHPGIARLLDAGHTAAGQPYLALEYVDGTPIDVYCHGLDLRLKLDLFLQVCEALSYAHRNLVIHRDLKPSNILVEADGHAKLLDFGIARILDDEGAGGLTRERLLTPDFASPEQVRGAARTTATDVYSLGAVLYQLLTGRSPHAAADGDHDPVEVRICTGEPELPSRLNPALPRDLDFILGKAMRKEPEGRYAAVDAFADDVRSLLESRPVRARSGSTWYRARKFLRRRWLPAAAAAVALLGVSVGLYTANRQRVVAQRRFQQLRQLSNKVLQLDVTVRGLSGSTRAREEIVAAGLEYLDGLGKEARSDRELALEVATGYVQLAEVQGVPVMSNLGHFAQAGDSLRKAELFAQAVLAADPGNPDALSAEANIAQDQMILADSQDHPPAEARTYGQRCAASVDALLRGGKASKLQIQGSVAFYLNMGQSSMNRHDLDDAIRYAGKGVEVARSSGVAPQNLAVGLSLLATALRQAGDLEGARARINEARSVVESAPFSNEVSRSLSLYTILWRQGQILGADQGISLGLTDEALVPLTKAFDLMEQQAGKDPNDATARDRESSAAWQLGDVLRHRDPEKALAVFDRSIMRLRELKNNVRARREEARLLAHSSYPLRSLHRQPEAEQRIESAFELLRAAKDYPAPQLQLGDTAADAICALADSQADGGHAGQAIATYRDLLDKVMASHPVPESDLRQATDLSQIYVALERLYRRQRQTEEAGKLDGVRLEMWRRWDSKLPGNSFVQRQIAVQP